MKLKFLFLFLFLFLVGCNNQTTLNTTDGFNTTDTQLTTNEPMDLTIEFRVDNGMLQWKYEDDSLWNDIYSLDNLDGVGIESAVINSTGELIITYTDASQTNLGKFNDLHLVQFLDGEGRVLSVQLVKDGEAAIEPDVPDLVGQYFTGWDKEFDEVFSDLVIFPVFFFEFYTAYLNENGGSEVGNYGTDYGIPLELPVPERPGYAFLGWYYGLEVNSPKFENGTILTSDVTLYAHWQKVNSINVKTEEELVLALNNEAYEAIYFDNNIEVFDTIRLTRSVEIYGNGYDLISKNLYELFNISSEFGLSSAPYTYPNNGKLLMSDLDIIVDHGIKNFDANSIFDLYGVDNFTLYLDKVDIIGNVLTGIQVDACDDFYLRYLNSELNVTETGVFIQNSMQYDIFVDNSLLKAAFAVKVDNTNNSILRIEDSNLVAKDYDDDNAAISVETGGGNDYFFIRTKFETLNNIYNSYAFLLDNFDGANRAEFQSVEINSYGDTYEKVIYDVHNNNMITGYEVTLVIGSGVDEIPDQAFQNKHLFSHVVLPQGLEMIGHLAFASNSNLQSILIPDSVEWIGDMAFASCSKLYTVYIPNSVGYIGTDCFDNANNLQTIYFEQDIDISGWEPTWNGGAGTLRTDIEGYLLLDGVTYIVLGNDDVIAVDFIYRGETEIIIPDLIEISGLFYEVKEIGNYAFFYNYRLTSVEIPNSITVIGNSAFKQNFELKYLTFADESNLTIIKDMAFANCQKLESVYLPDSLQELSAQVFAYNYKLEIVDFGENPQITYIPEFAFAYNENLREVNIPDSVQEIENSAFNNCLRLEEVNFGEDSELTIIGQMAFNQNLSLENFNLPDSVITISDNAFANNINLMNFEVGEFSQLETIGTSAFFKNMSLTMINLPDSVTSIGMAAFQNCYSLEYFKVPLGVTLISNSLFRDCINLEVVEFDIDSQVTEIDTMAFSGCEKLFATNLPTSLVTIGYKSFYGNISLEVIYIPDSVTHIEAYAFSGCINLFEVRIEVSSTLESVGDYAFENCDSLTEIYIPITVTFMGLAVFFDCFDITVMVAANTEPTGWNPSWDLGVSMIYWDYTPL